MEHFRAYKSFKDTPLFDSSIDRCMVIFQCSFAASELLDLGF
jgi:hypothetical protein